jgi:hypothetical protein
MFEEGMRRRKCANLIQKMSVEGRSERKIVVSN